MIQNQTCIKCGHRAGCGSVALKDLALNRLGASMGTSSNPSDPACHPGPCLCPGNPVADGPRLWDPAATWETRRRFLVSDWLSSSRCGRLGSEPLQGRCSSLSPLCISAFIIPKKKIFKKMWIQILLKLCNTFNNVPHIIQMILSNTRIQMPTQFITEPLRLPTTLD